MKLTAVGSGYFRVFKDGVEVSKHTSEREAIEAASKYTGDVRYKHDYEVKVEQDGPIVTPIPMPPPETPLPTVPAPSSEQIFSPSSIWKQGASGTVLPNSAALVKEMRDFYNERRVWAASNDYSIAKFTVKADIPKVPIYIHSISVDAQKNFVVGAAKSGTNLYKELVKGVRVPDNFVAAKGTDGHAFIHDTIDGSGVELFRAVRKDGKIYADWGATLPDLPNHQGFIPLQKNSSGGVERQGARASGLVAWGGVITKEEMTNGVIPHAIACSIPYPSSQFVPPATYSDGWSKKETWMPAWMWTPGIPEGTKFRVKQGVQIPTNLCQWVRVVGKAFQDYGFYVVDRSADRIGLYPEGIPGEPAWEQAFFGKKADGSPKHAYDIYLEWQFLFDNLEAIS